MNQLTGLLDRGHEVDVLADPPPGPIQHHPDVERYDLLKRTRYRPSVPAGGPARWFKLAALFSAAALRRPRLLARPRALFGYPNHAGAETLLCSLAPIAPAEPYDVIHCHFGPNGLNMAILRRLGLIRAPLVTTFYGFDLSRYVRNHGIGVYGPLFETGDRIVAICLQMKERLVELGCRKEKVLIHHLGVDCRRIAFASRSARPGEPLRLLSLARLVEKKGLEYSIRAAAELARSGLDLDYRIVGDGVLREPLAALIGELGVGESVRLLGWKTEPQILELLAWAHLLIAPSVTGQDGNAEGTPVTIMEAMASGLPVLSTRHSGIPELVSEDVSGCLVPERDAPALAAALYGLLERRDRWDEMGRAGRAKIESEYDIGSLNDRLVEIYTEAGASGGGE